MFLDVFINILWNMGRGRIEILFLNIDGIY